QGAASPWTDTGQLVEPGAHGGLAPQVSVVRDREAVCLIADALHEVERLRSRREHDRIRSIGLEELLTLLGDTGEGQVVQPELVENAFRRPDLRLAAVDQDQVRHRPATLLGRALVAGACAAEPAPEDLAVGRDIVRALYGPHPE